MSLRAGVARSDITDTEAGPVNDPLFAKALVLEDGDTTAAIITIDAVALGEIGTIGNDFVDNVRARLGDDLGIPAQNVLINASHCHGVVCSDVEDRTVEAVTAAARDLVPVRVGYGRGHEDRISENRRLRLRSGAEADVRHAYCLPADAEIVSVGTIDPEIGLLRLDRADGGALAVVYNFACHPIIGVADGGNTADISGFASTVIEDNLGPDTTALFLQGCCGDINPVWYRDVDHPRDAEPLGNQLGLSALKAARSIQTRDDADLRIHHQTLALPRADHRPRIAALRERQARCLASLQGTSLNLKTFLAQRAKYSLDPEFPSYDGHRYLHDRATGRVDLDRLDELNRANMDRYEANVHVMEELTRLQVNLGLLEMHQAHREAAGQDTLTVEVLGLRVGDFVLVTFPGELSVETGLGLKSRSPHEHTCVAAYTNGYIYYAPTETQLANPGAAQEDCDCLVGPGWQALYEDAVTGILNRL